MRMYKWVKIAALAIGAAPYGHAQSIKGMVVEPVTGQAIPFVNIGIIGKNVGTVSELDGTFELKIAPIEAFQRDSLRFSVVGYESATFAVKDWRAIPERVNLAKTAFELPTVTVRPKKTKPFNVGNTGATNQVMLGFSSTLPGTEIACLIPKQTEPIFLRSAHFKIANITRSDNARFRIHVYAEEGGLPGRELLPESVIAVFKKNRGTLTVDMSPYNLVLSEAFFIALELLGSSEASGVLFAGTLWKKPPPYFMRFTSQSNWEKTEVPVKMSPAPGFYVTVVK